MPQTTLEVIDLVKQFPGPNRGDIVHALNGVSLRIEAGTTLGVVGESGSGKSTLGRCVLRLYEPTSGRVLLDSEDVTAMAEGRLRSHRARMQMVFQDPYASANPRMRIGEIVEEPLILHTVLDRPHRVARVIELLRQVGLQPEHALRHPHQLSGGQLQRVGIARAIATDPALIVLDEPTSSLDVSVRAEILALLRRLQSDLGTAYLFVSHDLDTVRATCDRVAVMYLGRIVESGTPNDLFRDPQHPYTQILLSATLAPRPDDRRPRLRARAGAADNLYLPPGCPFAPRCPLAREECTVDVPAFRQRTASHAAACVRMDDGTAAVAAIREPDNLGLTR